LELRELLRKKDTQLRESRMQRDALQADLADAHKKLSKISSEMSKNEDELLRANAKIEAMEREASFEQEVCLYFLKVFHC